MSNLTSGLAGFRAIGAGLLPNDTPGSGSGMTIVVATTTSQTGSVPDGGGVGTNFAGAVLTGTAAGTIKLNMSIRKQQIGTALFEHTLRANIRTEGAGDYSGINAGTLNLVVDASANVDGIFWQANSLALSTPEQSVGASNWDTSAPLASQAGARFFCNWTGTQQLTITSSALLDEQILQSDDFVYVYYTTT